MKMNILVSCVLLVLASTWIPAQSSGRTAAQAQLADDTVPAAIPKVYVVGEVKKPGAWGFANGMRVLDALKAVGGPTRDADLSRATLTRPMAYKNGAAVHSPPITVRIDLILTGDLGRNVKLEADDVLYVPRKHSNPCLGKEQSRPFPGLVRSA